MKPSFIKDVLDKIIIPIYACAQGFLSLAQGSHKVRARIDKPAQEGDICDRCVHYRTPKLHF